MYKWGLEYHFTTITGNDYWSWLPIFRTKEVCEDFFTTVILPMLEVNDVLTIEHVCRLVQ